MSTSTIARSADVVGLDVGEPRRTIYVMPAELPAPLALPPREPAEPSAPETAPVLVPVAVPA
jgi:hypothetical protein